MPSTIATRWRELSGEKNWEGLLQPLDSDLRPYIIQYGQKAEAAGDLYDAETRECIAPKDDFFTKACLVKGNPYKYKVTHFLYACSTHGSFPVESSWFGYVAVSTDEAKHVLGRRDILVAWRGTSGLREWIADLTIEQSTASELFPDAAIDNIKVHCGFLSIYTGKQGSSVHNQTSSARDQVRDAIRELVNKYKDEEVSITITGFSLGAALATLTAMDIVANGWNKPTTGGDQNKSFMVTAFVYGSPVVGNDGLERKYNTLCQDHGLRLLRIRNERDMIYILSLLLPYYTYFGNELVFQTWNSPFLNQVLFGKRPLVMFISYREDHGVEQICLKSLDEEEREHGDEDDHEPPSKRVKRDAVLGGGNKGSAHNMDVYLHGIAIKDKDFKNLPPKQLDYDLPLVNKYVDRLLPKYEIPDVWWPAEDHKGMVQLDDGRWIHKG